MRARWQIPHRCTLSLWERVGHRKNAQHFADGRGEGVSLIVRIFWNFLPSPQPLSQRERGFSSPNPNS